jgi:hypothetical protein
MHPTLSIDYWKKYIFVLFRQSMDIHAPKVNNPINNRDIPE